MVDNKLKTHYKPNVVYELLIHGVYYYAGCHCDSRDYLCTSGIINGSGNYLAEARDNGLITWQEYKECVELVNVWEFDTKKEAQNFETLKIQELKEKYGDLCKNKALYGNQHSTKGVSYSEESKRKMSEARKENSPVKGRRWYTNGEKTIRAKECPLGFVPGRKLN